ncbi:MAG: hypothetical protein EZS28_003597 [Streblomastix strix]|uniref:Uncharacterized protein n=1 Tax=Streblomastix strix TaxID=222440 RepID=A0A5J4X2B1_9EUKA|nr:MAG: hypothetical protein EZS28_003597 [Streblomastix strix]
MSQTNIGIQNLAQLNEIIGQRDDINPKQQLKATEDMVNTFYLLNMMIGIGKQYVNQSIDDSGSFKRPFDNTGSIKRLIDTSGSINKLRFDNYEAIKRPIGNTGLIVVKDELKLPFTISPLSLADVLNAYQDPQSSSSSQTNISSQIDNQSEYILRTSLRLQRGLIEGAKQFYEGLFEDQARKKILEDEHSKRIAQIGSMDITYEQPLSISEQTDQLQTNFNRKNSFIRVAIGLCFLKHSNCQSILSQRSEQESAILDLTLTQKHLAGITQPQTRQQQTNNWPIEFESFTNDGYPLWPIIYFCIRCGKLQDALAILKYNSIEEAEEQLPLLQKEIQELKTIRQSEIIKDPRQDSQNKTSLLTINKSPHSDQHAQLCMNIIKNKIINKNDNYFYKELDRMLSNDSRDNEIEIMEDNGKIKINEDKEKKKQNGNSTEDKNKITNFISDSNDIYKIANPKQQSIIFLKPSNILSYYVSNVFTFNKPEKQDQQEAAITYCTLSSPNPGYIDEDPALINIAKIISSSNNNSFFEQPQFLSSILTPEAVSKVRQFCANEFSKEKNQAKEINILLQNPDPNDSVAFDRCNQFFETYLLFQPQYEPQRSDVIQMLQKYVDDFILKQKHTDYRISLQHNPIQYKMKLLVDIGNASSSAAEAVRMSQELRSGADINNDVYNNWLSVIQKMDEIDIISLLKEIKSSKSPQYPPECITKNISGIVKIYVEALNFLFRAISIRKYKMNDEQGIIQPINGSIQQMDLQLDEIRNRLKDLLLRFKETKGKNVENYEQVLQQLIYIQTSTQPNQVQKRQQK